MMCIRKSIGQGKDTAIHINAISITDFLPLYAWEKTSRTVSKILFIICMLFLLLSKQQAVSTSSIQNKAQSVNNFQKTKNTLHTGWSQKWKLYSVGVHVIYLLMCVSDGDIGFPFYTCHYFMSTGKSVQHAVNSLLLLWGRTGKRRFFCTLSQAKNKAIIRIGSLCVCTDVLSAE